MATQVRDDSVMQVEIMAEEESADDPGAGEYPAGGTGAPDAPMDDEHSGNVEDARSPSENFQETVLTFLKDIRSRLSKVEMKQDFLLSRAQRSSETAVAERRQTKQKPALEEVLFRSCRSIDALEEATNCELISLPGFNVLHCSVCIPEFDPDHHLLSDKVLGVFHFDFDSGTSFPSKSGRQGEALPVSFKTLRLAVKRHFEGTLHRKKKSQKTESDALEKGRFAAENSVAGRVFRTGYHVLKKSLPHLAFEELVTLQHKNGADMGSINHSTGLMPQLRLHISDVMRDMLARHLSAQPCVAVCADKVTVERRTIDIVAVISLVPNAHAGDVIQSFVAAAPVVKDHQGGELAREIAEVLAKVGVTHPDHVAAMCMDGQYHHLKVPERLLSIMASSDPQIQTEPCVVPLWDGSHLLNLAEKDARTTRGCEWVNSTIDHISHIVKRHVMGKGLETFLTAAKETGASVLKPKLWSETRFAPYAARTLNAFERNAPTFQHILSRRVSTGTADRSEEADLNRLKG